jgi:hypothetical protein
MITTQKTPRPGDVRYGKLHRFVLDRFFKRPLEAAIQRVFGRARQRGLRLWLTIPADFKISIHADPPDCDGTRRVEILLPSEAEINALRAIAWSILGEDALDDNNKAFYSGGGPR